MINPIVDWTDEDVWQFLKHYGCECNPLYCKGYCRVGCIGCPLANARSRRNQLRNNPRILKAWIKALKIYHENHPETSAKERFGNNAYNVMFFSLFCKNMEEYGLKMSTDLFGEQLDTKQFLEDYFKTKL